MKKGSVLSSRAALCFFMILTLMLIGTLRVMVVADDERYSTAATNQNYYRLRVADIRGTIYDCNMRPLTNREEKIITAVAPTQEAIETIKPYLTSDELYELRKSLSHGRPVLIKTQKFFSSGQVLSARVAVNQTKNNLAEHLIGYTDGSGHGLCGLQKAFDDILYSGSAAEFRYVQNSHGEILSDFSAEFVADDSAKRNGIKITIDEEIQEEAEKIAKDLKSGAIVVSEVGTGKIRALVSRPGYDVTAVEKYLDDDASPLINRALCSYNVGSVFKPCVAAAALEGEEYSSMLYECTGSKIIDGKLFACHKSAGHGVIDLKEALTYSCNTYFYTLAEKVGSSEIYKICETLNLGQKYSFAPNFHSEKGFLPSPDDIGSSLQSLANMAIGQGSLMLTPVAMLSLYEAIANDGVYYRPQLIEGYIKGGKFEEIYSPVPTRAFSKETAQKLKAALISVVKNGTGKSAAPQECSAAGKTATAQTGWKDNGKAVDHSWFCGFFPAEQPRYVVVIISENTSGGGTATAPLFARLADSIYNLIKS